MSVGSVDTKALGTQPLPLSSEDIPFDLPISLNLHQVVSLKIDIDGKSDLSQFKDSFFSVDFNSDGSCQVTRKASSCLKILDIPYDQPVILSCEEVIRLKISGIGKSDLPEYKDSHFDVIYDSGGNYTVTRTKNSLATLSLTTFDGKQMEFMPPSPTISDAIKKNCFPCFALETLPDEIYGAGLMGQVYKIKTLQHGEAILKIDRSAVDVRMGNVFYPLRLSNEHPSKAEFLAPLADHEMADSFNTISKKVIQLRELPDSPCYSKSYGAVFIKELNVWGILSEFIPGVELPENFENHAQALKVMRELAKGLKKLDEAGHPYTDLKRSNILLRDNGQVVLFDDLVSKQSATFSLSSRKQFGTLLFNALVNPESRLSETLVPDPDWIQTKMPPVASKLGSIADLITVCWSDQSINKISWDYIINTLGGF